ncbi:MAG TPA: UDP-glucose/GDP-mannose dehydrogenase family protein [Candidatus Thermoplasmatota archaeon]|nr:UDP-glucose/GDP-mannose dehydrogenase family protein [Candidatus Thermoplasmatota archaeon]
MRVTIVGAGFVGISTAISLAENNHAVTLVEVNPERLQKLRAGVPFFFEEGVAEALKTELAQGRLAVADSLKNAPPAEVIFLCVGTPPAPDGSADLRQLRAAAREVAMAMSHYGHFTTVAVKSTVPPGTTRGAILPILAETGKLGETFGLAMTPEFLREGTALADARNPDRVVIGAADPRGAEVLSTLLRVEGKPLVVTDPETAEMIKYVSNSLLATKVGFANEIANLSYKVGVNVDEVMKAVGLDHRLGPHFLKAGPGFGGSCFPKDLAALDTFARQNGIHLGIVKAVLEGNEAQPLRVVDMAAEVAGGLAGKRVTILGVAFKAGTSDVRETRAQPIYEALVAAGAHVTCYDPIAQDEFCHLLGREVAFAPTVAAALDGADVCILHTDWPEFRSIPAEEFARRMRSPIVVDSRRFLDGRVLAAAGVTYRALGNGTWRRTQ